MASRERKLSRRAFLATGGWGLAAPYVLTGTALGAGGKRPASDRVIAASIGVGGRGTGLLGIHRDPRCTIAAVCDVYEPHMARAKRRIGKCDAYQDFRRIIDRRDIDAVLIATPDHWHACITVMACESGKDVYCEKPLTRTLLEGRRMVAAARRYGRVVQMGTQYRSSGVVRQICEWVRNGRLGKVDRVRVWHPSNRFARRTPNPPVPKTLDWDLWLGPAPWAPYHPLRCLFTFRWFMDYGSGSIADNGTHMFSIVSWAMGTDQTGPVTIEGKGTENPDNFYDVPVDMHVRYQFADPRFVMTWEQPGEGGLVMQFIGRDATLTDRFTRYTIDRGKPDLSPTRPDETHFYVSNSHSGNWLDCIASRRRPVLDVAIGHRVTSFGHLGNIAYLLGRKLRWDPKNERFLGDAEANRLLHVPYREPWQI